MANIESRDTTQIKEKASSQAIFIAFEGNDGAGKTTLLGMLVAELRELGIEVNLQSSPGKNTLSGSILRANIGKISDPNRANLLFAYDIERTLAQLSPSLQIVFFDRFLDSVLVSNGGDISIARKRLEGSIKPTKTIFLDLPPEISYQRELAISEHPISLEWLREKYARYQAIIKENPDQYLIIDASRPIEEVYADVRKFVFSQLAETIDMQTNLHSLLLDHPGIIRLLIDNPAEVKPGVFLPMFVNLKEFWGFSELRATLADELAGRISQKQFDCVMGLESGGGYYSARVADQLSLPLAFLRTKSKDYGDKNSDIVGHTPKPGDRVALIDDVYATGQSTAHAVQRLESLGCTAEIFTIFSYSPSEDIEKRTGVKGSSLTYFSGIVKLLRERGLASEEEIAKITKLVDEYRNTIYD